MGLFWDSVFQRDIVPFAFAKDYIVNSSLPFCRLGLLSFGVGCKAMVKTSVVLV